MATKVKFTGPDGMVNRDVGRETGGGDVLKTGKTYEVSAELAERLTATAFWERPRSSGKKAGTQRRRSTATDPADATTTVGEGADTVPGDTTEGDK